MSLRDRQLRYLRGLGSVGFLILLVVGCNPTLANEPTDLPVPLPLPGPSQSTATAPPPLNVPPSQAPSSSPMPARAPSTAPSAADSGKSENATADSEQDSGASAGEGSTEAAEASNTMPEVEGATFDASSEKSEIQKAGFTSLYIGTVQIADGTADIADSDSNEETVSRGWATTAEGVKNVSLGKSIGNYLNQMNYRDSSTQNLGVSFANQNVWPQGITQVDKKYFPQSAQKVFEKFEKATGKPIDDLMVAINGGQSVERFIGQVAGDISPEVVSERLSQNKESPSSPQAAVKQDWAKIMTEIDSFFPGLRRDQLAAVNMNNEMSSRSEPAAARQTPPTPLPSTQRALASWNSFAAPPKEPPSLEGLTALEASVFTDDRTLFERVSRKLRGLRL